MIKSRTVRLAVHVARMREIRNSYIILVEKPVVKRQLGKPSVDGRVILKWVLKK
jgi:hypothetical protein